MIEAKVIPFNERPIYTFKVYKIGCKRARCILKGHNEDEAWENFLNFHLKLNEEPEEFDIYQVA